ncbi:hypothetical protein OHA21_05425 [Actinoplanes sp. NBC_00393]|uniref:hypothetical protein n=1 Tax=Actinoplanes sp. NBC_00393 TaxID=2975953 RepID=UPI002E1AD59A
MSQHPDVVFETEAAFPVLQHLRSALARRDWPGCRTVLDSGSSILRTNLIRCAGTGDEQFLREVFRHDPGDGAAAAMLGACLTHVGWEIRGSGWAKDVSREQWDGFHARLREAEQVMIEGAARSPRDPAIWTCRLTTARGLEAGHAEARRRYDRAAEIDPHHYPAQTTLIQQLYPKWGGTWEEVHGFAREAMLAAPAGGLQGGLVAEAHIEHWVTLRRKDKDEATAYLHSPAVRDEIYEAAHRSVGSPQFRREWGWVGVGNEFAFLFSEYGDRAAAAWLFNGLGTLATKHPWHWLRGEVVDNIRERRAWARGEGELTR